MISLMNMGLGKSNRELTDGNCGRMDDICIMRVLYSYRCIKRNYGMDWQILLSTFGLVFVAELGDKTQLAVMTQTCKFRRPWVCIHWRKPRSGGGDGAGRDWGKSPQRRCA